MKLNPPHKPPCFGVLDHVFPPAKDGLRHAPDDCMACELKTECLQAAMKKENGLKFQEAMVDRAYKLKKINFLERWSKKKCLNQQQKKINEK